MAEPCCCDEPMVRNSFTGDWECSNAFFQIIDDLGDGPGQSYQGSVEGLTPEDVPDYLRPVLAHWRASRRPYVYNTQSQEGTG